MFCSSALLRWRTVFTVGLVLSLNLGTRLPAADADEGTPPPSRPIADDGVSWVSDTVETGLGVASTDLRNEGMEEEKTFEGIWAQYLSQPPNETADAGAIKQPYYLVDDATDERSDAKA